MPGRVMPATATMRRGLLRIIWRSALSVACESCREKELSHERCGVAEYNAGGKRFHRTALCAWSQIKSAIRPRGRGDGTRPAIDRSLFTDCRRSCAGLYNL